jgi:hypothetical protein
MRGPMTPSGPQFAHMDYSPKATPRIESLGSSTYDFGDRAARIAKVLHQVAPPGPGPELLT